MFKHGMNRTFGYVCEFSYYCLEIGYTHLKICITFCVGKTKGAGHNNLELLRNNGVDWGHFGIVPCTSFGQLQIGCWFPSPYRTNLLFELTYC